MKNFPAKTKIYLMTFVWLVVCATMFGYFFKLQDGSSRALLKNVELQKKNLYKVKIEEESFRQAKEDLEKLKAETYQPEDFFSKDTTLVNEIKILEELSRQGNVDITLSGVAGTVKTVPRTTIKGSVLYVPYSMAVAGAYGNVIAFIETLENLSFVTNITALTVSAGEGGEVTATFTASFYLKQPTEEL